MSPLAHDPDSNTLPVIGGMPALVDRRNTQLIGLGAFVEAPPQTFLHYMALDLAAFYAYLINATISDPTISLERTGREWYDAFSAWKAHVELMKIQDENAIIDITARES